MVERVTLNLPAGVSILGGQQGVAVRVDVTPLEGGLTMERELTIEGLGLGLKASPSPAVVDVILSGPLPRLETLQPEEVQVILNLFELEPGTHKITPQVIAPEGIRAESILPETIEVVIERAPTPTPRPVPLENGDFEDILPDSVPGWEVAAVVNWEPGDDFNPDTSYARPEFKPADDSRRLITGSTLQIQTFQWVKFKVTLYQIVEVEPGSQVWFEAKARGYSSGASIRVQVGIDPHGRAACEGGLWGELRLVDQTTGVVTLHSPEGVVGPEGRVTVCLFAEPQYALIHNAAFFDDAELWALSGGD